MLILVVLAGILLFSVIGYSFSKNRAPNIQGEAIRSTIVHNQLGEQIVVDDGIIRIGVITPLSGEYAFIGKDAIMGFELAKEKLEAGVLRGRDVQMVYKDSQCDPDMARLQEDRLQEEGIAFIVSLDCYGNVLQGKDDLLVMTNGDVAKDTYSFTTDIDDDIHAFLDIRPQGSTYVLFVDNSLGFAYKKALEKRTNVIASNAYEFGRPGFSDLAKKVAERRPDQVFVAAMDKEDLRGILAALRSFGYYDEVLTNVPVDEEYLDSLGKGAFDFEGIYFVTDFDSGSKRVSVQEFIQEIRGTYGVKPATYAANAYDTVMILGLLMARDGKDPVSVKESLTTIRNYEGITGLMTFSESQVERTAYVRQVLDGRIRG